ncbi:MAG: single-stranded DNA-binding protein [Aquificaceae bacterium]|uniref:single-stranded DNA-binding protein n=1 Tax=Hydrogenobacter sp. Uz 6-8 TaxID=3384828 RepID=UPI000F0DB835|nr:MAG: single-stranded DNA-binding protein [Aquificota bacterium]
MLNKVIIIGRLVKDPLERYMPSGTRMVEFTIAYNRRYMVGEVWKEESHFFEVKAYGKLAESLVNRISKGYTVVIEGRLTQDRWMDKEGKGQSKIRIVAESVRVINKPRIEEPVEEFSLREEEMSEEPIETPFSSEDDEIPF